METNSVVKGTFAMTSIQVVQYFVLGLFYVVVTKTNALTETDLGVISILTFLGSTISTLTALSLPTALTKYVSESIERNEKAHAATIMKTINTTVLVLSTLGLIVTVLLSGPVSVYFWKTQGYAPLVILMSFYAYFQALMILFNSSLQAFFLFGNVAIVTLTWVVLSRSLGAFLAFLHFGVYGVTTGYVAGYGIAFVLSFLFATRAHSKISPLDSVSTYMPIQPLLRFSLPLFLSAIIQLALNWSDIVVLASITSDYSALGVYYLAVNSVTFLSALYLPITFTVLPLLSARNGVKDFQGINDTLKTVCRYLCFLMLPCCVGLAIIAPTALRFFYGQQYVYGSVSFAILSLAQILVAFYFVFTTSLTAIGKTSDVMKINIVSVFSYIGLLLVLVPIFAGVGAASARFTMQAINLALAIYLLRKNVKVGSDKESLWKSVIASMAILPILTLTDYILASFSVYMVLIVDVAAGVGTYLLLLYLLKALKHQDFELLKKTFPFLAKYVNAFERIIVRTT